MWTNALHLWCYNIINSGSKHAFSRTEHSVLCHLFVSSYPAQSGLSLPFTSDAFCLGKQRLSAWRPQYLFKRNISRYICPISKHHRSVTFALTGLNSANLTMAAIHQRHFWLVSVRPLQQARISHVYSRCMLYFMYLGCDTQTEPKAWFYSSVKTAISWERCFFRQRCEAENGTQMAVLTCCVFERCTYRLPKPEWELHRKLLRIRQNYFGNSCGFSHSGSVVLEWKAAGWQCVQEWSTSFMPYLRLCLVEAYLNRLLGHYYGGL